MVVMVVIIGLRVGERRRAYMAGAEAEEDRHVALFSRAQRSVAHACAVRLRAAINSVAQPRQSWLEFSSMNEEALMEPSAGPHAADGALLLRLLRTLMRFSLLSWIVSGGADAFFR